MTNQTAFEILSTRNGRGFASDASSVAKMLDAHGEKVAPLCNTLISAEQAVAISANQKGAMRTLQTLCFILSGDVKNYQPVYAMLASVCALAAPGQRVSYATLHNLLGARVEGADVQTVKGVNRQRLIRHIDTRALALGTYQSKTSAATGKNGFLGALGVVKKSDAHGIEIAPNAGENAFLVAFAFALERMTDGALELVKRK